MRAGRKRAMNEQILQEISEFCRARGLAESTFGRRAVNDGKLASRLRNGGRITTDTLDRIRAFMAENRGPNANLRAPVIERDRVAAPSIVARPVMSLPAARPGTDSPQRNFRFFDNR